MPFQIVGPRVWGGGTDDDGYGSYTLTTLVEWIGGAPPGGPNQALRTAGLPLPGSEWAINGDEDEWAFCTLKAEAHPSAESPKNEPCYLFEVVQHFSKDSCKDGKSSKVDDPLLEPYKISGSFTKFTEEATQTVKTTWLGGDQFNTLQSPGSVINSAWEQLRGHQVEFDNNRPTVKIEQNVVNLQLNLISYMVDTVNDRSLWGLSPRKIKLASVSWEKKYYKQCFPYYTRALEFEIDYRTFDRLILDEGNKVLHGEWNQETGAWDLLQIDGSDPDPANPAHFDRFKDRNGEFCKVILDGHGQPWIPPEDNPVKWWCINNGAGAAAYAFQGTCADAKQTAFNAGAKMKGPFDSEEEATDGCTTGNYLTDPDLMDVGDFNCPDSGNGPGHILLQKYTASNFLLLGIPTVF